MALHERLVALQSTENLRRKSVKARRKGFFTVEDIDYARRWAKELGEQIKWE